MSRRSKAQVAIEFLILMSVSIIIGIIVLIIISTLSRDKIDEKTYYELDDFGSSIQQEILLASELENGYMRAVVVPYTVNGRRFNITIGTVSNYSSYLLIKYQSLDLYYVIPPVSGNITTGRNTLTKLNNTLRMN